MNEPFLAIKAAVNKTVQLSLIFLTREYLKEWNEADSQKCGTYRYWGTMEFLQSPLDGVKAGFVLLHGPGAFVDRVVLL